MEFNVNNLPRKSFSKSYFKTKNKINMLGFLTLVKVNSEIARDHLPKKSRSREFPLFDGVPLYFRSYFRWSKGGRVHPF